ncbi:MAG: hypothetical protein ACR2PZ_06730 [Pseudomonadales bacterium]
MKKLALITAFVLVTGCAALDPTPEATASATPSVTPEDVQKAVDDALTEALAVNRENAVDVEATIDEAVQKAITRTVHEMKPLKAKNDQAEPAAKEVEPVTNARQVVKKVGITRLQTVHPTVTLKREIRDCTLELLMFDTHAADAADACLRIYRSQYRRHPSRADGSVPTTIVHQ